MTPVHDEVPVEIWIGWPELVSYDVGPGLFTIEPEYCIDRVPMTEPAWVVDNHPDYNGLKSVQSDSLFTFEIDYQILVGGSGPLNAWSGLEVDGIVITMYVPSMFPDNDMSATGSFKLHVRNYCL